MFTKTTRITLFALAACCLSACQPAKETLEDVIGSLRYRYANSQSPILVRVGTERITVAEFEALIKKRLDSAPRTISKEKYLRQQLDQLVRQKLIAISARQLNSHRDLNYQYQVALMKDQLLRDPLMDTLGEISDDEARRYYELHKPDFAPPSQIEASRIVLKTPAAANEAQRRLKRGTPFAEVAKKLSIDKKSAAAGGHMGTLSPAQLEPAIVENLSKLKPGQFSGIIRTALGFEIWKKIADKQVTAIPQEELMQQVKMTIGVAKLKEIIQKTEVSYPVNIDETAFEATLKKRL